MAPLTQYKPTRKENKMAAKTGKKKIKVQDLKPKKDAKGGLVDGPTPRGPKQHGLGPNKPLGPLNAGH